MITFMGYDKREDIAYEVAKRSLLNHATEEVIVVPLKQDNLRDRGLYWRPHDPKSSTEFSFTRFLTPYLANYQGWALFVDCDFLFRGDITKLEGYCDPSKALYVVQHDYQPKELTKMDGALQHPYPRKNWSSFMWINCAHPQVKALTPEVVNSESGMYLHRFEWLTDDVIGKLPETFNYLEGWHTKADVPDPIGVHMTRGGPWFPEWQHVEYAKEWYKVMQSL